jgi:ribosomal protein S18 acetylase RimI-like enzyme
VPVRTAEIRGDGRRVANVASSMWHVARRLGWAYALLWLCTSVARRLSLHVFVVTTHPIDCQNLHDGLKEDVDARLLTPDEVARFFDCSDGYGYSRTFADQALARGDRCVGVLEHGRLLWYCWYAKGPAPVFENVEAVVDRPYLYAYNAYTDPAHRRRGLHQTGAHASARIFAREGYRALTAYIEADNSAPLIASQKMGERVVGVVAVHRRGAAVRWFATRGCRQGGFRIRRKSHSAGSALDAGFTKVCN